MTAARILDRAHDDHRRVDVVLVDPRPTSGRGVAYSTDNPSHLLNVPARSMSAYPDDPTHLLRWLSKRGQRVAPDAFIPRKTYGRYLDDVLATAQRRATGSTLTRARERAVDISWKPGTCRLRLASGTVVGADAVVLALGHLGVTTAWAPEVLRRSARFITDPWAPDRLATVPDGDLLLVGAGLTMVDVVLSLRAPGVPGAPGAPGALGRAIHAISRTGELPRRHAQTRLPAMEPPELSSPASLTELRAAMAEHVALSLRRYGDWRPAVDSIRPLTQQVWRQLSEVDKAHFLAEDARLWDSLRHRVPPRSADVIDEERQAGRLVFHTGRVLDAVESGDRVRVTLSDGSAVAVAAIVNCTGPSVDPQASHVIRWSGR